MSAKEGKKKKNGLKNILQGKKDGNTKKKKQNKKGSTGKKSIAKEPKKTAKKKTGQKNNTPKTKKISGLSIFQKVGIGVVVVAALYIAVSVYFSNHFFFRTEINGFASQFKTVEQVKEMIRQDCSKFELVLKEREEQQEVITSEQISLQFVDDGKLEAISEGQKGYQWITALFNKPVYEDAVTIAYDDDAFETTMNGLTCMDDSQMKEPEQAYPAYNEETQQFEIVKEVLGTKIDKDIFEEVLREALLSDMRELDIDQAGCYVEPKFYSDDQAVIDAKDQVNKYLATEITYDMGYTQFTVEKEAMSKWIAVDGDSQVSIDEDKVGDYVQWLGTNYNTCGIRRSFTTPEGKKITVSGGTYGWRINHSKEVEKLVEVVQTGEKVTREPVYRQTGQTRDSSGDDLHDTYIAISIESQTMWYYKNGTCLLTTPVVTGNVTKNMGTPTGVYAIAYKQRDHVLRGDDYESPVDYWMPFYEYRGIGIHDASWRQADQFGGEIYKTNGSHGCVNTPYDAVKTLFETVATGTPVVVY